MAGIATTQWLQGEKLKMLGDGFNDAASRVAIPELGALGLAIGF
jgi:hypothetical protein